MLNAKDAKLKSLENNDVLKTEVDMFLTHFQEKVLEATVKGVYNTDPTNFMDSQLSPKGKELVQNKLKDLGYKVTYKEDPTKKTFSISLGWS